ncbi:MAG: PAS-domain containing protein [Pseudomonadota bacterium]
MTGALIIAGMVVFGSFLAMVALWGDRHDQLWERPGFRALVFSLALAVYATSWTFFGAVGTATKAGYEFLPIFLGPILVFTLGFKIIRDIARSAHAQNATSLASFLSTRYGKSRAIAVLVTMGAIVGVVPYIALQLRSITMTYATLVGETRPHETAAGGDLLVVLLVAVFVVYFGTRNADMTKPNRGLMLALSIESAIKIVALAAISLFAFLCFMSAPTSLPVEDFPLKHFVINDRFITLTLLSAFAIICLPRQFHVTFVEGGKEDELRQARWLFPLYLAAIAALVVPIAVAGLAFTPSGTPDLYVLGLPLAYDEKWLAGIAFLGGFSAATGMVVVATLALSNMIASELVTPFLLMTRPENDGRPMTKRLLVVRRLSILAVLVLAYFFQTAVGDGETLANLGILSFAAVAQFAPAIVGALYWRSGHRIGAFVGLSIGFVLWFWTLMLPLFGIPAPLDGPLFNSLDPLTIGVAASLGMNTLAYVVISLIASSRADQRDTEDEGKTARVQDLKDLLERCLGPSEATQAIDAFTYVTGKTYHNHDRASKQLVEFVDTRLTKVVGASSARVLIRSATGKGPLAIEDVVSIIDETSQKLQFKQELLQASLEHLSQGVSVVDEQMRLVAWNSAYQRMFEYPNGFLHIGQPVSDLIRFNARKGAFGEGDANDQIEKRVSHMRAGLHHVFERHHKNGQVLRLEGNPMPGGGYVTCFSDITEDKRREAQLEEAKTKLETRVKERTAELHKAMQRAEDATASKTRFLAAASHDLLQPLNAARLFTSALAEDLSQGAHDADRLVSNIDKSINSADQLLKTLLNISKIDAGGIVPTKSVFSVATLFNELETEFGVIAERRGLALGVRSTGLFVESDQGLLRSMLQNFISNAIRYTSKGRILVGARKRGDKAMLQVWDTGPGIPEDKQKMIFEEFSRLDNGDGSEERGVGLGLAMTDRLARLLDHPISLRSREGRGSIFGVAVPIAYAVPRPTMVAKKREITKAGSLKGQSILCLDDDPRVLQAYGTLLAKWQSEPILCTEEADARAHLAQTGKIPDIAIVDYYLGQNGSTKLGPDVFGRLCNVWGKTPPVLIVSAEPPGTIAKRYPELVDVILTKPVAPAALRAMLQHRLAEAHDNEAVTKSDASMAGEPVN